MFFFTCSNNCVLIMMSIYMESFLERHPNSKYLFTDDDDAKGPARLKCTYSKVLREEVWRTPEFIDLAPEASLLDKHGWPTDIGTHSGRKCPAEYAANCGALTVEIEIRGRWKGQKGGRVIFRYINIQQAFEDARVAALLCRGGAVRYKLKDGVLTLITDAWLFEHVVPNVHRRYPSDDRLCRVLALSLLYICLRSNEDIIIPDALCNRVKAAYAALGLEEEEPVEKVQLHVYRMPNGTFGISDTVPTGDTTGGPQGPGAPMTAEMGQTILVRLGAVETQLVRINLNVMNGQSEGRAENRKLMRITNNNMRAFGGRIQGALVRQRASNQGVSLAGEDADDDELVQLQEVTPATLSNNPRSLHLLWQEYKFGINGRNPAEQFNLEERNTPANKQKYYRRNLVWQTMARLVRGGLTAEVAIGRLHSVYGYDSSTSKIMTTMVKDKRRYPGGMHPNLR
jgi:hypothetical protein